MINNTNIEDILKATKDLVTTYQLLVDDGTVDRLLADKDALRKELPSNSNLRALLGLLDNVAVLRSKKNPNPGE